MPRNGSGVYTLPSNSFNPAVGGTDIDENDWNSTAADLAGAITASIASDGQTTITADLPMAGFKHTGVGAATARTQYAVVAGIQDGSYNWVVAGGTADALTAIYAPALTALVDGQLCFFRATSANATTTPTFAPNGLMAHTITQRGGAALLAGNIAAVGEYLVRYNLANTRWELLNPSTTSRNAFTKFTISSPTGTNSGTPLMMGLGSTWTLTPLSSRRVRVDVRGFLVQPAGGVSSVDISSGTGTAPINGAALAGAAGVGVNAQLSASGGEAPFSILVELTGLTLSTAYWFDLNLSSSSGIASVKVASVVIEEF